MKKVNNRVARKRTIKFFDEDASRKALQDDKLLPNMVKQTIRGAYSMSAGELRMVAGWVRNSLRMVSDARDHAERLGDTVSLKSLKESVVKHVAWLRRIEVMGPSAYRYYLFKPCKAPKKYSKKKKK